jgi:hypothetical protein
MVIELRERAVDKGQVLIVEIESNGANASVFKRRPTVALTVELDEQTAAVVQELAPSEQRSTSGIRHPIPHQIFVRGRVRDCVFVGQE